MTQYFPHTTNSMSRYLGQFTVKSGYNEWPRCRHVFSRTGMAISIVMIMMMIMVMMMDQGIEDTPISYTG